MGQTTLNAPRGLPRLLLESEAPMRYAQVILD